MTGSFPATHTLTANSPYCSQWLKNVKPVISPSCLEPFPMFLIALQINIKTLNKAYKGFLAWPFHASTPISLLSPCSLSQIISRFREYATFPLPGTLDQAAACSALYFSLPAPPPWAGPSLPSDIHLLLKKAVPDLLGSLRFSSWMFSEHCC